MEHKIKNISDIDWDLIFTGQDILIWQNRKWAFTELVGHFPDAGGPVIITISEPKKYFCLHSSLELEYFEFDGSFLDDSGENLEFLLPLQWSKKERNEWFGQYKKDRLAQEKTRDEMLQSK